MSLFWRWPSAGHSLSKRVKDGNWNWKGFSQDLKPSFCLLLNTTTYARVKFKMFPFTLQHEYIVPLFTANTFTHCWHLAWLVVRAYSYLMISSKTCYSLSYRPPMLFLGRQSLNATRPIFRAVLSNVFEECAMEWCMEMALLPCACPRKGTWAQWVMDCYVLATRMDLERK